MDMDVNADIELCLKDINNLGYKKLNLNSKEVANVIGVSPQTVENWRKQGIGIEYLEIGKRILYPKRAIAEFLLKRKIITA